MKKTILFFLMLSSLVFPLNYFSVEGNVKVYVRPEKILICPDGIILNHLGRSYVIHRLYSDNMGIYVFAEDLMSDIFEMESHG